MNGPQLRLLEIEITTWCGRKCGMCYLGKELNSAQMSVPAARTILEAAAAMHVEHVVLSGGEPLLHPLFNEIVTSANELGILPGVLTNGMNLSPERVRGLSGRVSFVQLSLHDLPDGDGYAAATVARIAELKAQQFPVTALITISRPVLGRVDALLDFAEDLGVPVGVQRFCTLKDVSSPDLFLPAIEYLPVLRSIWERMQANEQVACEDPLLNRFMDDEFLVDAPEGAWIGCAAGLKAAVVTAEGKLIPCAKLRVSDANVFASGLAEAWAHSPLFEALRHGHVGSRCGSCKYFPVCRGCRAEAYNSGLGLWGKDPLCSVFGD